jgi:hypothetical protein
VYARNNSSFSNEEPAYARAQSGAHAKARGASSGNSTSDSEPYGAGGMSEGFKIKAKNIAKERNRTTVGAVAEMKRRMVRFLMKHCGFQQRDAEVKVELLITRLGITLTYKVLKFRRNRYHLEFAMAHDRFDDLFEQTLARYKN